MTVRTVARKGEGEEELARGCLDGKEFERVDEGESLDSGRHDACRQTVMQWEVGRSSPCRRLYTPGFQPEGISGKPRDLKTNNPKRFGSVACRRDACSCGPLLLWFPSCLHDRKPTSLPDLLLADRSTLQLDGKLTADASVMRPSKVPKRKSAGIIVRRRSANHSRLP